MRTVGWVFSGIGVAVVAFLLSPLRKYFIDWMEDVLRRIPAVERRQMEEWAGSPRFAAKPSAMAIVSEVAKRPPLQRGDAGKSYQGLMVVWSVRFQNVIGRKDDSVTLMVKCGLAYPWAFFEVRMSDYPSLKTYTEGKVLWVAGTISGVESHEIRLENCKLRLF